MSGTFEFFIDAETSADTVTDSFLGEVCTKLYDALKTLGFEPFVTVTFHPAPKVTSKGVDYALPFLPIDDAPTRAEQG